MKKLLSFLLSSVLLINMQAQKPKVIIDADTGNEIDDMPAIVLALKSDKVDVLAVTAAQWNRVEVCGRQTMDESWVLNNRILQHLEMKHIPSLKGSELAVGQGQHWGSKTCTAFNEASDFIIKRAMEMPEREKLIVIVTGSATNVASAIISDPKIIDKIAVYFIGTTYDFNRQAFSKNEFNVRSDLNAVETLFNTENLELHVMPANICTNLKVSQNDIDTRLKSKEGIEGMLKELWVKVNKEGIDWTMWDFAIVQAVINPQWTKQVLLNTPPENTPRKIYVYSEIESAAIMDDFWKVFLK
jgi:inosine-uridine nucleoside N-ribohydrolase